MKKVLLISVPAPGVEQTDIENEYWSWHYALKTKITYTNLTSKQLAKFGNTENQNIGLLSIASALREHNILVDYIAPDLDYVSYDRNDEFLEHILDRLEDNATNYVALSSATCNIPTTIQYAQVIRHNYPNIRLLVGGAHVNGCNNEELEELSDSFDYIIRGKGEIPIVNLVLGKEDMTGICYKRDGHFIVNELSITAPDNYPKPANDLLNVKELPAARVFTSLGCEGRCIFCVDINTKKFVYLSIESILDEIKYLYDNYKTRYFYLGDENFFARKDTAVTLLEQISKLDLDLILGIQGRIEGTSQELIKTVAKYRNCTEIQFGVESASQEILKKARKGLNIEKVRKKCKMVKKYGMSTHCYFLVGLPGETEETAKQTLDYIDRSMKEGIMDFVEYRCVVPFPGSGMWNDKNKYNITLNETDWTMYRGENMPVYDLDTMSAKKIYEYYLKGLRMIKEHYKSRYIRDFGGELPDVHVLSSVTEGGF